MVYKKITSLLFLFWNLAMLNGQTPGAPGMFAPGITVTHNQFYCAQASIPVVSSAQITDGGTGNATLEEVFVQISEGYVIGEDLLSLDGVHPGITASWSPVQGLLTLSGTASLDAYETAIESVVFETSESIYRSNRSISISLGSASFLPSNGHYYIYVSAPGIRWDDALEAAAQTNYFGLQGYLATITSPEEAQLVGEQSPGTGWIGGSDAAEEGVWRWVTGPENGMIFWRGTGNGSAPNGAFAFWNCAEPNNFQGNEDYAHITDNSVAGCGNNADPAFFGSWNDLPIDSGETNPDNPYYPKGYIVEFGGLPDDPEINLSASSVINMPQVELSERIFCGSGVYDLSVSGNADEYHWYDSAAADNLLHVGDTYSATLNSSITYWISPRFSGCTNGTPVPYQIVVEEVPQAVDLSVTQCDNEGDTDGITTFNLSAFDIEVANGDLLNKEVSHYEDAQLNNRIDSRSYTNRFNGQVIYALVENTLTNCSSTAQMELNVTVSDSNSAILEACDDLPEDGFTVFDLSQADDQVIPNPGLGITTAYYESYEDALLQINELPLDYTNTTAGFQVIYVRLQEGNNCFGINEVELYVNPLPQIRPDETVYYCTNTFPEPILIDGGIENDVPNNYYYLWSTGETTMAIEINEPGTYSVEVTEVDGCSNFRTITVVETEKAIIESIEVQPSGDLSTLTIEVSGSGDYVFALDNELGPYQGSNSFENVRAGVRKVYVKELNGNCGISEEEVSVIGYPKYFTPNGDGQNDLWYIQGFNSNLPFMGSVRIFDRYGKELAQLNAANAFWDGTYAGTRMPSNDYWFIAELANGESRTGHFSLKR
jgi:gliding motility-associated-like protein